MPLAYVDKKIDVDSTTTVEGQNFMKLIKQKLDKAKPSDDYDIAIRIELKFQKGNSFDGIGVQYDKDGVPINMSEEDLRRRYPLTYKDVVERARKIYSDFKQGKNFNDIMRNIKTNEKLYYERKLDAQNPKSQKKGFYSANIWQELDKSYHRDRL